MKRAMILLLALGVLNVLNVLNGCGEGFENEEMLLGDEQKLRPLAIVCEPAEISPGREITVTMHWWDPDPDGTHVGWRAALDYDPGMYGTTPVERGYVDLDEAAAIEPPVDTGDGFMVQTFTWTVPATVLRETSAIPADLDEEPWDALAAVVSPGETLTQADMDDFLSALTPADLEPLDEDERDMVLDLADLFACQIRLRASLRNEITVDVTRNVTVRHSGRLGSPNVNENTRLTRWELVAVPRADVDHDDLDEYGSSVQRLPLIDAAGQPLPVAIPARSGWTYFLETDYESQRYTSPFSGDRLFDEHAEHVWYSFRLDGGDPGHPLLRNEDGEETEMWELDEWVRIVPPDGRDSRFRVFCCVRDDRPEWEGFFAAPGAALSAAEIEFTAE